MFTERKTLFVMLLLLCVTAVIVLTRGLDPFSNSIDSQIIQQLRLPLVITATIVGAALAVSSACLQVLLRNPLADPGIIGITNGASLFAAFMLLLGGELSIGYLQYLLPLCCFLGALLSTWAVYAIAKRLPGINSAVILAGIAISTVCGAIIAWLHLFSDAESMRNLTFWLMGSLHQADWTILSFAVPAMLLMLVVVVTKGKQLNWYYFGAGEAQLAGLNVRSFNKQMLILCALLVGIAVSIAGSIAFVGLIVPHLLRNIFGNDNRFILPASAITGGLLLMVVVLISDWTASVSVPVSMLTATLGGPIFLYSLIRLNRQGA